MARQELDRFGAAGDLFGEIYLAERVENAEGAVRGSVVPGLLVTAAAAGASAWLSEHYGFPIILLGLLIGLALNFVARDPATHRGLDLASRTCLRLGIVVLGFQITVAQVGAIGPWPFAALVAIMLMTFAAGLGSARLSGQSRYAGILAGGATAICGASAALALYGIIGRERLPQAQFALTLVGVSLASALAMSLYPVIAGELGLSDAQAGFLIGASVHDVAQAIGGGFAFSDTAGNQATIVKLTRVALLAPAVLLVSLWIGTPGGRQGGFSWRSIGLPWFIVLFGAVVAISSAVALPDGVRETCLTASKGLLLLAVTATAMRSRIDLVLELGWRAATPVAFASLVSFAASLGFVLLIGV